MPESPWSLILWAALAAPLVAAVKLRRRLARRRAPRWNATAHTGLALAGQPRRHPDEGVRILPPARPVAPLGATDPAFAAWPFGADPYGPDCSELIDYGLHQAGYPTKGEHRG